jgi:hypothetical protein
MISSGRPCSSRSACQAERAGHLGGDEAGNAGRDRRALGLALLDEAAQIDPVQPLHGEEALVVDGAELEELHDAGMMQVRTHPRLADQRVDEEPVASQRRPDALDDALANHAMGILDGGAVDDTHSAFAELLQEPVPAEHLACTRRVSQGHVFTPRSSEFGTSRNPGRHSRRSRLGRSPS